MTTANARNLQSIRKQWQNNSMIPRWKRDGMIDLVKRLEKRIQECEDCYEKKNVKLFFPEDCTNYDVFMAVGVALEARVRAIPTGFVMYNFGRCKDFRGIE